MFYQVGRRHITGQDEELQNSLAAECKTLTLLKKGIAKTYEINFGHLVSKDLTVCC